LIVRILFALIPTVLPCLRTADVVRFKGSLLKVNLLMRKKDVEVVEGVGLGAETADDDGFMDDVEEPLSAQRTNDVATPSGEDLFPLAFNCKF
jgi:hypothetical protein